MQDNKNLILAMVLSFAILLGWQFLIVQPKLDKERAAQEIALAEADRIAADSGTITPGSTGSSIPQPGAGATTGVTSTTAVPGSAIPGSNSVLNRQASLLQSERITIETARVSGSINLKGARIDDLKLLDYHETVDLTSPNILLLSPAGTEFPYYAEFGWVAGAGQNIKLPNNDSIWSVEGNSKLTDVAPVTLVWDNQEGLTFKRKIAIDENFMFTIDQSVSNSTSTSAVLFPYGLISRHGTPETSGFYILHEGLIGFFGEKDSLQEIDYDDLVDAKLIQFDKLSTGWLGITDKYWAAALVPSNVGQYQPSYRHSMPGNRDAYQVDYLGDGVTVVAGGIHSAQTRLFAGAKQTHVLQSYADNLDIEKFDLLIDWGWFYYITKPLFKAIDYLFALIGNFGVAILIVTVGVKILFFPLANKSYASMSKMKKVQPKMEEIRKRHGDDKQRQQQAMMELYKKEKINPLAGCLPIVVQIPVFFSLYKVLFVTIEMRHAPFFGWIQDLSAPDPTSLFNLFGLIPFEPPQLLMLGIWPLLMGITMFIQMKLNPAPTDPTQQMIFNWMPVVFTFMLASFPAGLVIYWAWNNFLSILQQSFIMRRHGVDVNILGNILETFGKKKKT